MVNKDQPQKQLVNLGLFNSWCDNPPKIYLDCVEQKHKLNGRYPVESIYLSYEECPICGYCYTIDTSG